MVFHSTSKQVLFLNEMEEILEVLHDEQIQVLYKIIFKCLLKCISSEHFQIAERTLLLWSNETLSKV